MDNMGLPGPFRILLALVSLAMIAAYIGVSWVIPIMTFKDEKATRGAKVKWGIVMAIFGIIVPATVIYMNLPKKAQIAETGMNLNVEKGAVVNVNVKPVNVGNVKPVNAAAS